MIIYIILGFIFIWLIYLTCKHFECNHDNKEVFSRPTYYITECTKCREVKIVKYSDFYD